MAKQPITSQTQLAAENEDLRARLGEAEETLRAIRSGEVDAIVVPGKSGEQLFTLKGADQTYRVLIEEMSEGALTLTTEGMILYANRRFGEMLKSPLEKVIGSAIHAFIAPDSKRILELLLRKGEDEKRREPLILIAGDGTPVPVSLSVNNLPVDGMHDLFGIVAIDLTEQKLHSDAIVASEKLVQELLAASNQSRVALLSVVEDQKQAEESLRQSEEKFSKAFHTSPYAITITHAQDGRFVEVNDAFTTIAGYTREESLADSSIGLKLWVNEEDRQRVVDDLRAGKAVNGHEYQFRTKNGKVMTGLFSAQVMQLGGGSCILSSINDITGRKRAEESLKSSEDKFRDTIRSLDEGYYSCTKEGLLLEHNLAFNRILGFDPDLDLKGKKLPDFWQNPDDRKEYLNELMTKGFIGNYLINAKKADGEKIVVLANSHLVKDEEDRLVRIVGTFTDFTVRKRAEESLIKSESKLRTVLDAAPFPVAIVDVQDDNIEFWSHSAYRIFGHTAPTTPQWYALAYPDPEYRQEVIDRWKPFLEQARSSGQTVNTGEYRVTCRDGSVRICELYATFLEDILVVTFNDLTERKNAEADLRIKNQVFEDSIASQSIADKNGVITHVNPAFLRLWGYATREQAIGNSVGSFFANPADAVPVLDALAAHDAWEGEFLARRVDGKTFISRGFATSLRNARGDLAGYQSTNLDVTKEKDAEQSIARLNRELLLKNAELEQVVYVASHDLRSPLVNVQGFCKELAGSLLDLTQRIGKGDIRGDVAKSIAPIITTDIPESLGYIQTSVARMDSLLSGLLKLSRLGRAATSIVVLDIGKILSEVLKNFEYTCKQKGAEMRVDGPLPSCRGDQVQTSQVFSNLVDNALKYLDPSRPGKITISGTQEDGNAVYCVADNGIGMAPEHCEKAFEIFHRLDPKFAEGEGLGLTIVRRSLDKQGGRVWAESEPGKGSRFLVSLPGA